MDVYDLQATVLHLLGFDHERPTYKLGILARRGQGCEGRRSRHIAYTSMQPDARLVVILIFRSRSRGKNREWTRMDANLLRMYASSVYSRPFVVPFLVTDQTGECSLPSLKLALAKVLVDQKAWLKLTCEESRRRCDSAFCRWQSQSTFAHGNVGPQRHVCLA